MIGWRKDGCKRKFNKEDTEVLKRNQRSIVDRINRKVEETTFATENLISLTHHITDNVEIQREAIEVVVNELINYSSLAQNLLVSTGTSKEKAENTMETARRGKDTVESSIEAMNEIKLSVGNTKNFITDLSSKSNQINEILSVIKSIVKHTKLLSLNASIEAARAGEAGKGFAVVADEIKSLSDSSGGAADDISNIIAEINQSVTHIINSIEDSMSKVERGDEVSTEIKNVFDEIIDVIGDNVDTTNSIDKALKEQCTSLDNLVLLTKDMDGISKKVMTIIDTVAFDTQYTKTTLNNLLETSKILKRISDKLLNKVKEKKQLNLEVNTYLFGKPYSYNPQLAFDIYSIQLMNNIHSGLLYLGNDGQICAGVAKNWHVEDDNITWVFNLRRGAVFHNGREIIADDIKYSFESLVSPSLKSYNKWFLDQIEGVEEYFNGQASEVKGIKVINRYKIAIKLTAPYSGFIYNLGQYPCSILAKEDLERGKITGCGAYIIEKIEEERTTLKSFKDYYGGIAYIDKVVVNYDSKDPVKDYIGGKYEFMNIQKVEQTKDLIGAKVEGIEYKDILSTHYIGFNLQSKSVLIKDIELRRAMSMAVNKKRVIEEALGGLGTVAKGPIPLEMLDDPSLKGINYNLKLAKEIVGKKKHLIKGKKLILLGIDLSVESIFNRLIELFIEDMDELGIECIVERVAPDKYLTEKNINKADVYFGGWSADTGDIDNFVQPLFNPANKTNHSKYNNPQVLEMMEVARSILNKDSRDEVYKEMQQVIVNDIPWIFLYHPKCSYVSREGIGGLKMNALGQIRYEDIMIEGNKS